MEMGNDNKLSFVSGTACLAYWLEFLNVIQEVSRSIPGYTLEIFLEVHVGFGTESTKPCEDNWVAT